MTNSIEIYAAKWKLYSILLVNATITALMVLVLIKNSDSFPPWTLVFPIFYAFAFLLPAVNNLTRKIPLIAISDKGLFVKGQRFEIMPWDQMAEVKLVRFRFYLHDIGRSMRINTIVIIPRDPEFGALPDDGFMSTIVRASHIMNKNRIFVSAFGLDRSATEIYSLICQRANIPIEAS